MSDLFLTGPSIKRGKSRQDYETPWAIVRAVESRFGPMVCDLAATEQNKKAPGWIDEKTDSLSNRAIWPDDGNCWLNPPSRVIGPWAKKCWEQSQRGAKIFMLVPASVGSNWFRDYVHRKALVLFLSPRISFDGENSYPKDLLLICYGLAPAYECWNWQKNILKETE